MPADRPILIVGCPRSGTSLLRDLLRAHRRITIPPESQFLPDLFRLHGDPADDAAARRAAADLVELIAVPRWGLAVDATELSGHRSFAGLVAGLYGAWARREGKPRWGDKTPSYTGELSTLRRIVPQAQVVHLVRDPRSVAASLVPRSFGPTSVRSAAALWRNLVEAARRDGPQFGGKGYHELRYEDLTTEPESELRRLCAFLDEEFEPSMLIPNRLPARGLEGDQVSRILPPVPASRALGRRQSAVVAWEAGDLMEELGYEPAGERRPPVIGERRLGALRDRAGAVRARVSGPDRASRNDELVRIWKIRLRRALGAHTRR